MIHIPILRRGVPYTSLDVATVVHHRTRQPFATVSQANSGLIRRDLLPDRQAAGRRVLAALPVARLLDISREAADRFLRGTLTVGADRQSPQDYVEQVSATTGMPFALVRRNMDKIAAALEEMPRVLAGLTRGLDLAVLDASGVSGRSTLSFYPRAQALGRRAAEQLARGARAVDSGHRAEDAARVEAWERRTLDSLPDCAGVHGRGVPA